MDWIKQLKLSNKLMLLVTLSLIFVVVTGSLGYFYVNKASKDMENLYNQNLLTISKLGTVRGNLEQGIADVLYLYCNLTPAEVQHWKTDLAGTRAENKKIRDGFLSSTTISDYEKERWEKIREVGTVFWANMYKTIALQDQGQNAKAISMFTANLHYILEYRTLVGELIKYNQDTAEKINSQNMANSKTASTILIVTLLASFGLLISLGLMMTKMISGPISKAIGELDTGSSEVSAASIQVEQASQHLAEGSTEQAASLQETSSTLEETASMVQQNNENTKQAALLARNTKEFAEKSNKEMNNMMSAMTELNKSSNEIAKIIKVIDEIAFQTNLLSLNAAVEAARAGDAGKGFAVVAEEVRNLAQRSAKAAKDTAVIIESNISLAENSSSIAKEVETSLGQIDSESKKVSELLGEISTATEEQSRGISEINKAVSQMEEVTNTNAQMAEECSSAARELESQASNVKDILGTLHKVVNGAS